MKKITKKEFDSVKKTNGRPIGKHGIKARELICEFIESGEDIMEIESSDFDDAFDFKNVQQRNQAASYLRSKLGTKAFNRYGLDVTVIKDRMFIKHK